MERLLSDIDYSRKMGYCQVIEHKYNVCKTGALSAEMRGRERVESLTAFTPVCVTAGPRPSRETVEFSGGKCPSRPYRALTDVGRIVGVNAGCAVVAVSEPFLDRAERGSYSGHPRPEGVAQIVKPHRSKPCATRSVLEPSSQPRWIENATAPWMAENEVQIARIPRALLMPMELFA
jgi:hypothetical protein